MNFGFALVKIGKWVYNHSMLKQPNYQKMIEWLAVILRCPICSNKYNAEQTSIIDTKENQNFEHSSMLVHTECERCKSSVVFSISMDGPEIFSVGMVTDLTSTDAKKFRNAQDITVDDVIGFHGFLNNFDGDFERALVVKS